MTWPWTLAVCAALGIWLMAVPAVLDIGGGAADALHVLGPVTAAAVVATAEVVRSVRLLVVPLGITVAVVPFVAGRT